MYWIANPIFNSLQDAKNYIDTTPAIQSLQELIQAGYSDLVYKRKLDVIDAVPNINCLEPYKGQYILLVERADMQKAWVQYHVLMRC